MKGVRIIKGLIFFLWSSIFSCRRGEPLRRFKQWNNRIGFLFKKDNLEVQVKMAAKVKVAPESSHNHIKTTTKLRTTIIKNCLELALAGVAQ